jgi:hypothetical protein
MTNEISLQDFAMGCLVTCNLQLLLGFVYQVDWYMAFVSVFGHALLERAIAK